MLVDDARLILAAWQEGLLTDDVVRGWSYEVLEVMPATQLPDWLLDLSTLGPAVCMSRPSSDFLDVPRLDYHRGFSLRVLTCDFADPSDLDAFIAWASSACMGEDLEQPEVRFGYQLDHLVNDCSRLDSARDLVAEELPRLETHLVPIPDQVLRLVRRSKPREQPGSA